MDFQGQKKHSGEEDQLILAIGGSEHVWLFSVAISWGNKMNFTLYANMAGLCSDGHRLPVAHQLYQNMIIIMISYTQLITTQLIMWMMVEPETIN